MSTSFHPQTDGQSERTNHTIEVMLRCVLTYGTLSEWAQHLPSIEFFVNTQVQESTRKTTYEVLYGFNPKTMPIISDAPEAVNHEQVRAEVTDALFIAKATMAAYFDQNRRTDRIKPGDSVYVSLYGKLKIAGVAATKLAPKAVGPFKVLRKVGTNAYEIDLPNDYNMHRVISLYHLRKAPLNEFNRTILEPPPIKEFDDGTAEFEVEKVLAQRTHRNQTQYLVKWKGYAEHRSTWIDHKKSDSFASLRDEFLAQQLSKPKRKQRPEDRDAPLHARRP